MAIKVKCNCPDSTGKRPSNVYSNYSANLSPSDWSGRFAGISDLVPGAYCKHEMAAIIYFDKESETGLPPKDMVVPENMRLGGQNPQKGKLNPSNKNLGDYFGWDRHRY